VRVKGGIPRRSCQGFIFFVGDVHSIPFIGLCKAEVYDIYLMGLELIAHQEVVGLNISMNNISVMTKLDSLKHLKGQHYYGLGRKLVSHFGKVIL